MIAPASSSTRVVLFDLGGVLVELGPSPLPPGVEFHAEQWIASRSARDFETGRIDAQAFARSLIDEFDLEHDARTVLDCFRRWPEGLYPGVVEILAELRRGYRVAILSNTNALHWERFTREYGLDALCDQAFASHRLGLLKPDPQIFDQVIGSLGVAPGSVLFIDDNPDNVDAARGRGLQAECARGFDAVTKLLADRGLVASASDRAVDEVRP